VPAYRAAGSVAVVIDRRTGGRGRTLHRPGSRHELRLGSPRPKADLARVKAALCHRPILKLMVTPIGFNESAGTIRIGQRLLELFDLTLGSRSL